MKHQIEVPNSVIKTAVILRLAAILANEEPGFAWYQDARYCDATVTIPRYYAVPSLGFLSTLERYAAYLSIHESLTLELSRIEEGLASDTVSEIVRRFKLVYSN